MTKEDTRPGDRRARNKAGDGERKMRAMVIGAQRGSEEPRRLLQSGDTDRRGSKEIVGACASARVTVTLVRPSRRLPWQGSGGDGQSSAVVATEERRCEGNAPALVGESRRLSDRLFILFCPYN